MRAVAWSSHAEYFLESTDPTVDQRYFSIIFIDFLKVLCRRCTEILRARVVHSLALYHVIVLCEYQRAKCGRQPYDKPSNLVGGRCPRCAVCWQTPRLFLLPWEDGYLLVRLQRWILPRTAGRQLHPCCLGSGVQSTGFIDCLAAAAVLT